MSKDKWQWSDLSAFLIVGYSNKSGEIDFDRNVSRSESIPPIDARITAQMLRQLACDFEERAALGEQ